MYCYILNNLLLFFLVPFSHQQLPGDLNVVSPKYDLKDVKCLVCQAAIEEILYEMEKLSPDLKVEVGNYRLDSKGNMKKKSVPLNKSETKIAEVLEGICEKFDNYAKAVRKDTKQLTILRLMSPEGGMNPEMSNVQLVQDDDLNKSLKHYCQAIMEEHDEIIINHLIKNTENLDIVVCSKESKICPKMADIPDQEYYSPTENDEL